MHMLLFLCRFSEVDNYIASWNKTPCNLQQPHTCKTVMKVSWRSPWKYNIYAWTHLSLYDSHGKSRCVSFLMNIIMYMHFHMYNTRCTYVKNTGNAYLLMRRGQPLCEMFTLLPPPWQHIRYNNFAYFMIFHLLLGLRLLTPFESSSWTLSDGTIKLGIIHDCLVKR